MKTSIAMTTYNGGAYLQEQLDSFTTQKHLPDELIVSDDGSTDNTLDILNAFKNNAPFHVQIVKNGTAVGYTRNFSAAIQLCTHELVFLSDQDDVWFPDKIEHIVKLSLIHKEKQVFIADAALTDKRLNDSGLTKLQQIRNAGLNDDLFVTGCCVAARLHFLKKIVPVPNKCAGHDVWISMLSTRLGLRMLDPVVLQHYRRHDQNSSNGIANDLVRQSLLKKAQQRIQNCTNHTNIQRMENIICHQNAMLLLLQKKTGNEALVPDPASAIVSIQEELLLRTQRLKIALQKNLIVRIFNGLSFYSKGKYQTFNGLRSCICDILGSQD